MVGTQATRQAKAGHTGFTAALGEALPRVCTSTYEVILFQAAFILALFRAFCCSELVAESKQDQSGRAIEALGLS